MSGRAVEAAGDVDVLLLDKTGTITLGNRQATEFHPLTGVTEQELAEAAQLASLADETPEGRSIVVLAKEPATVCASARSGGAKARFIPFTAQTRMSGADGRLEIRKGAVDAIHRLSEGPQRPDLVATSDVQEDRSSGSRARAALRSRWTQVGARWASYYLKDIVKGGVKERFAEMRAMGIRTVMITGDNPLTAAAIAAEAGVDDFLAQATPEKKLELIREEQGKGRMVAMSRRRHQRRACARASGCRRRHADRYGRGARSRQHGRSRQRSNQAHRDCGDRQAIANDARRADHVFDRQRCGEIFRHHPGDVCSDLSFAGDAQRHGPWTSLGDIVSHYLQCAHHRAADPTGVARRRLSAQRRRRAFFPGIFSFTGLAGLAAPFVGIKIVDLIVNAIHLV